MKQKLIFIGAGLAVLVVAARLVMAQSSSGDVAVDTTGASAASTYKLDLWSGHPMEEETKELFREWRRRASELRERIDAYNAQVSPPPIEPMIFYLGLCKDTAARRAENALDESGENE